MSSRSEAVGHDSLSSSSEAVGHDGLSAQSVVAIIPLKALAHAKGRLEGDLTGPAREELAAWMFERVVTACRVCRSVREVLVVAGDARSGALARAAGVRVILQGAPGLRAAVAEADAATAGAGATLVVAADLPLASPEELDAVCVAGAVGPAVVIAPTADGGTGALLRRPPGVVAPAFGPLSARAHRFAAEAAGVPVTVLHLAGLALDVDTAAQLRAVARKDAGAQRWVR